MKLLGEGLGELQTALLPIGSGIEISRKLADKATALIKSLPKALRRNFVPAPDFGRAFAEAYSQPEADSIEGALARFLKKLSGVDVSALDFDAAGIDAAWTGEPKTRS